MTYQPKNEQIIITNAEHYVLATPNEHSSFSYEQQGVSSSTISAHYKKLNNSDAGYHEMEHVYDYFFAHCTDSTVPVKRLVSAVKKLQKLFYELPNVVYLPTVFEEKITHLTPDIESRYEAQVTTVFAAEAYQEELLKTAKCFKQYEAAITQLSALLELPEVVEHLPYVQLQQMISPVFLKKNPLKTANDLVAFLTLPYTNPEELEYWFQVVKENPHFLTEGAGKKFHLDNKLLKSMDDIYYKPELGAFEKASLIVCQSDTDQSIHYLGKDHEFYVSKEITDSFGVFFDPQHLQNFIYRENTRDIDFVCGASYEKGQLKSFFLANAYDSGDNRSRVEHLNIVLERLQIEKNLNPAPTAKPIVNGTKATTRFKL